MSADVMVREQQAVATTDAVSFIQMIERASRDPSVDIDKMERLMQMHERMVEKKAESDFNDALVACQGECGTISADATNPQTRSKYASYAKLDKVLRPIYTKHGISISYGTEDSPKPEHVRVIAYVAKKGYTRIYRSDMPADGKGAKGGDVMTKTHAAGAAMSYGARYLLKGIFNISIGEDDNDGNRVTPNAGAGESLPTDVRDKIATLAAKVNEWFLTGSIGDAFAELDNAGLDNDEKLYIWTFFDSKQRSALKKEGERVRAVHAADLAPDGPVISAAQKKRLEARIGELKLSRDKVKAHMKMLFAKEHFADLTTAEYDKLDKELEELAKPDKDFVADMGEA